MSLQANLVSIDMLKTHEANCDEPCCQICVCLWEREYEADRLKKIEEERDYQLDEYERAELENDRSGWDNDDLRSGDPSRA